MAKSNPSKLNDERITLLYYISQAFDSSLESREKAFGIERNQRVLQENRQISAEQNVKAFIEAFLEHIQSADKCDDITILAVKRT